MIAARPGVVLATISGHDHAPDPPYSVAAAGFPAFITHPALVEGAWPAHTAYSLVSVLADCTVVLRGFGDAYNATFAGPPGCSLAR